MKSIDEKQKLPMSGSKQPKLDEELFKKFKKIHPSDVYSKFTVVEPGQKQGIVDDWRNGRDPNLTAVSLDTDSLKEQVQELRQFKKEVLSSADLGADVKQLYRWKINEDIANILMLLASSKGDTKAFRRWNDYIYGKPDELIYRAALDFVGHDAEKIIAGDYGANIGAEDAARIVLDQLDGKRGYREILYPESDVFNKLREDHWRSGGYYALLLAGVNIPEGHVGTDVGVPILKKVIENLGSDYELRPSKKVTWEVAHGSKSVNYPDDFNLVAERFVGLPIGHEIGTHLLETVNGLRSALLLISVGLDRQEQGGEGRGVVREQLAYDNFDYFTKLVRWRDILRRHIAISYSCGLDGGEKSSYEVWSFMNAIDKMYQWIDTPQDDSDKVSESARLKTDTLLLRVLKGTDGKGGAYLKDKVYLEGHVAVWLAAALRGAKSISEGDAGKFDISNPRHLTVLQRLGVLPSNDFGDNMELS